MVDVSVGQLERFLSAAIEQIPAIVPLPNQIARTRYGRTNGKLALGSQSVVRVVPPYEHHAFVFVEVVVHQPDVLRHGHFFWQREVERMRDPVHVVQNHHVVRAGDQQMSAFGVRQFQPYQSLDVLPNPSVKRTPTRSRVLVVIPAESMPIEQF